MEIIPIDIKEHMFYYDGIDKRSEGDNMVTKRDEIYNFIISYMRENVISPSIKEICIGVGLKSTSSVHTHLKNLQKLNLITMRELEPRTIRPIGYALVRTPETKDETE